MRILQITCVGASPKYLFGAQHNIGRVELYCSGTIFRFSYASKSLFALDYGHLDSRTGQIGRQLPKNRVKSTLRADAASS